ncbi:MAG TPA: GNAT family N-acetyltransferase [Streptosporangiaceae bacterium]|nr:GNAT family N-acetyltransferase [Streptosporangiaceae bacterium]
MDIIAVDRPADAQIRSWHAVVTSALSHDQPEEPLPTLRQTKSFLTGNPLTSRRLLWTAVDAAGATVGVACLRLPTDRTSGRPCEIEVRVHPAHRRRGTGSRLLRAAAQAVRADGGSTVVAQAVAGTPAIGFLEARGFRCVLVLAGLLLRIEQVDGARLAGLAGSGPSGYRLVRWTGTVPTELADTFARAKTAMSELPVGNRAFEPGAWDADRVREMAEVVAKRGDDLYTVAAVCGDPPDVRIAGFTEVVVPGAAPARAAQYDTAVVPEHRGKRLGIWVKADMLRWLRAERPDIREIETDNADDNSHMLAVNEELGFRRQREYREYQADVADLP